MLPTCRPAAHLKGFAACALSTALNTFSVWVSSEDASTANLRTTLLLVATVVAAQRFNKQHKTKVCVSAAVRVATRCEDKVSRLLWLCMLASVHPKPRSYNETKSTCSCLGCSQPAPVCVVATQAYCPTLRRSTCGVWLLVCEWGWWRLGLRAMGLLWGMSSPR